VARSANRAQRVLEPRQLAREHALGPLRDQVRLPDRVLKRDRGRKRGQELSHGQELLLVIEPITSRTLDLESAHSLAMEWDAREFLDMESIERTAHATCRAPH
jgi:hypothetical protein